MYIKFGDPKSIIVDFQFLKAQKSAKKPKKAKNDFFKADFFLNNFRSLVSYWPRGYVYRIW